MALKVLWRSTPESQSSRPARALKEGRLLARLRHPNVVTVYGADHIDGRVGLWMEFVKGQTLAQLVRSQGPFGAREAALIGLDLCRALAAVHTAGVLHGDIKAHNVMREEGGRTVLMDFGTGKDLSNEPRRRGDDFAGTPLYLAPEVFAGQQRTVAADIYSLGVLLYHLVTDAYPVEGRTREEVERAHQRRERRHLRDVRADLPDDFVQVVEQAVAPNPQQRHRSAGAFESALAHFLGSAPGPQPSWLRANRARLAAAAGAAAILVAGTYWMTDRSATHSAASDVRAQPANAGLSAPELTLAPGSYRIDTALYRALDNQQEVRLRLGARVTPGDRLFVEIRTSVPTYVYIVNEDDLGHAYLLFPLPGQSVTNPLPPGQATRLPGARGNDEIYWQVDQAGGREHFLIFASPERLSTFEQMFAALPRPEIGRPVQSAAALTRDAVGMLRSVGGLASQPAPGSSTVTGPLSAQFQTPLGDAEETARGVWVRQLTLDNPGR